MLLKAESSLQQRPEQQHQQRPEQRHQQQSRPLDATRTYSVTQEQQQQQRLLLSRDELIREFRKALYAQDVAWGVQVLNQATNNFVLQQQQQHQQESHESSSSSSSSWQMPLSLSSIRDLFYLAFAQKKMLLLGNDNSANIRKLKTIGTQKTIGTRKHNSEGAENTKHVKDSDASSIHPYGKNTQDTSFNMCGSGGERMCQPGQHGGGAEQHDDVTRKVEPRSYQDVFVSG